MLIFSKGEETTRGTLIYITLLLCYSQSRLSAILRASASVAT